MRHISRCGTNTTCFRRIPLYREAAMVEKLGNYAGTEPQPSSNVFIIQIGRRHSHSIGFHDELRKSLICISANTHALALMLNPLVSPKFAFYPHALITTAMPLGRFIFGVVITFRSHNGASSSSSTSVRHTRKEAQFPPKTSFKLRIQ